MRVLRSAAGADETAALSCGHYVFIKGREAGNLLRNVDCNYCNEQQSALVIWPLDADGNVVNWPPPRQVGVL